jgi:GTPase
VSDPRQRNESSKKKPDPEIEKDIAAGTKTLVVGPYPNRALALKQTSTRSFEAERVHDERLAEAVGLTRAIDLAVAQSLIVPLSALRPSTYLGKGKVEELAALIKERHIALVVMDCALSPVQQRNLEKAFACKVIDRTGLILEIFGRRARTKEGSLQVELAHLTYQKSRLVRSWTHLERQRGGFGFLGGPGETQIETDRRLIQERMTRLERELETVKRTRGLHRESRGKVPYPIVALVGYTNAGKSTLFNTLAKADVFAKDLLFATLDPTARAIELPHGQKVILSDTVGFISDLPTMLIAAFRATLEDAIEADVILHVRDISHGESEAQAADVREILGHLGIVSGETDEPSFATVRRIPVIEVWNKADLLNPQAHERALAVSQREGGQGNGERPALVSAVTGEGLPALLARIEALLGRKSPHYLVTLDPSDGAGLAWLYEEGEVLDRRSDAEGRIVILVRILPQKQSRLETRFTSAKLKSIGSD